MLIPNVDSDKEIRVNLEMVSVHHCHNKGVLSSVYGEYVLRWEMEWSQISVLRVWDEGSTEQKQGAYWVFGGYTAGIWETKAGYAAVEICVAWKFESESVADSFLLPILLVSVVCFFNLLWGSEKPWDTIPANEKCISQFLSSQCCVTNESKTQRLIWVCISF